MTPRVKMRRLTTAPRVPTPNSRNPPSRPGCWRVVRLVVESARHNTAASHRPTAVPHIKSYLSIEPGKRVVQMLDCGGNEWSTTYGLTCIQLPVFVAMFQSEAWMRPSVWVGMGWSEESPPH